MPFFLQVQGMTPRTSQFLCVGWSFVVAYLLLAIFMSVSETRRGKKKIGILQQAVSLCLWN